MSDFSQQKVSDTQCIDSDNEIIFQKYKQKGAYHWREYFGNLYHKNAFVKARYDLVIDLLKNSGYSFSSSPRILEVGCGDGALCAVLKKTFKCEIHGFDPSKEGIRMAKEMFSKHQFSSSTFTTVSGYTYPYQDNYFDAVVCADVIEHVQHPDKMLSEMKRVLRPGGQCVITTPIRLTEEPKDEMHVQEWYPSEFAKLCEEHFSVPKQQILSHPIIWYELYSSFEPGIKRAFFRFIANLSDSLGRNVFLANESNADWRSYSMQSLLLEK